MVSAISKAAAKRILPFATKIESLQVMRNGVIQVTYWVGRRRCSTFLSKMAFYQDFLDFRREGAKSVTVRQWGAGSYQTHYSCHSSDGKRTYTVKLMGGLALCECPDYEKQHQELGRVKPGCKHLIAVLNHLKYSSLEAYLKAKETEAKKSIFAF